MRGKVVERTVGRRDRLDVEALIERARPEIRLGQLLGDRVIETIGVRFVEALADAELESARNDARFRFDRRQTVRMKSHATGLQEYADRRPACRSRASGKPEPPRAADSVWTSAFAQGLSGENEGRPLREIRRYRESSPASDCRNSGIEHAQGANPKHCAAIEAGAPQGRAGFAGRSAALREP